MFQTFKKAIWYRATAIVVETLTVYLVTKEIAFTIKLSITLAVVATTYYYIFEKLYGKTNSTSKR